MAQANTSTLEVVQRGRSFLSPNHPALRVTDKPQYNALAEALDDVPSHAFGSMDTRYPGVLKTAPLDEGGHDGYLPKETNDKDYRGLVAAEVAAARRTLTGNRLAAAFGAMIAPMPSIDDIAVAAFGPPFEGFPKMPRLNRQMVVSEKVDGTNGHLYFYGTGADALLVGSKSRYVTPAAISGEKQSDNLGFAAWAYQHREELFALLGPGKHFGEWYGQGIQRGYGLTHKRFALFNTSRWTRYQDEASDTCTYIGPESCGGTLDVVHVMWRGPFDTQEVRFAVKHLRECGSQQVPGFMRPEGVVVYQEAAKQYFKVTVEKDEAPKSKEAA